MPEPLAMEIPVSVPGIGDAIRQMAQMARAVKQVGAANSQLTSSTRTLSQVQQQQGVRVPRSQPTEAERNLQRQIARSPLTRLRRVQEAMQVATPEQREALGPVLAQAQRRLLLAQRRGAGGAGILGRIGEAVASSRIGAGGAGGLQLMPLVSRVVDVLESIPGPVGLVTKALLLLTGAAIVATKNIQELASASVQSGGSIREVATLRGLGLDPGQIAGAAGGLRERLISDPNAASAANQLGLPPTQPFVAGGQDNAKILLRSIDALRKVADGEERLRLARMLGLEAMTDLLRVSDYVYAGIKANAAATAVIVNDSAQQAQADLSASWGAFVDSIKLLATAIGTPLMKILAPALSALAYLITGVALAINATLAPINAMLDGFTALLNNSFVQWLMSMVGGGGGDPDKATKDNTDALNANTRALSPGTFGGGERLRGALPGSLGGELLRRGMEGNAIRMGAFSLG